MAHGGRSRPHVAFKEPAHSPILEAMEPTIVALERATFSYRPGRLELGVDALTIHHPKLQQPVEVPLSAIAKVIIGPGSEVCRRTTIPAGIDPKGATLVLALATPGQGLAARNAQPRGQRDRRGRLSSPRLHPRPSSSVVPGHSGSC
jgi:hypothetical protein